MAQSSKLKINVDDKVMEVGLRDNTVSFYIRGEQNFIEMSSQSMLSIFFGRLIMNIIDGKVFDIENHEFFTYDEDKLKIIYEQRKKTNQWFKENHLGDYINICNNVIEVKSEDNKILRLSRTVDKIYIGIEYGDYFVVPNNSSIFYAYNKYFVQLFNDLRKYKDLLEIKEVEDVKELKKM